MTDIPDDTKEFDDTSLYDKPLYKLLHAAFPQHRGRKNRLDVRGLGVEIGYSYERIYVWLREGKLNAKNAKIIVDASNGAVDMAKLIPFILA